MTTLDRNLRRQLDQTVRKARTVAEQGARQALGHLAVAHHLKPGHLDISQGALRNRLRARARQLGDRRDAQGRQAIDRLIEQCAYEHWHRMLFARFLAENELLFEPESNIAVDLEYCRELALREGRPWIAVASEYAVRMLPQVFRPDDAVLDIVLPAEHRTDLEALLESLPSAVFTAADSLGWTYQFWQADAKDRVNRSEKKIGAETLGAVTQLFTEDYMVDFLLHNTLGAWWAGKLGPISGASEEEARAKTGLPARGELPAVEWQYLRFIQGEDGTWRPAAGTFDGWPKRAREITMLDPCMGSGHFPVFALPILARLRAEEERSNAVDAVTAVLRDNLFGLELDERCTQIAAFNLALTAWKLIGHRPLPQLNLACSGLSLSATQDEWVALANGHERLIGGMKQLYQLFKDAPILGSLINPRSISGELLVSSFSDLEPLLVQAVARESSDDKTHELAITAQGVAKAAEILASTFTLVATNVPYLGRGKQDDVLKEYAEREHGLAKADLATCFVERCTVFCAIGGTASIVTPQNWLFLTRYSKLRRHLLGHLEWNVVARIGARAFETITGEVVNVALLVLTRNAVPSRHSFSGIDVSRAPAPRQKADALCNSGVQRLSQIEQSQNAAAEILVNGGLQGVPLAAIASCWQGIITGDDNKFFVRFWELPLKTGAWKWCQSPPQRTELYTGKSLVIRWDNGEGSLHRDSRAHNFPAASMLGRRGIAVQRMGSLNCTLFHGEIFGDHVAPIIPHDPNDLAALWCFCTSSGFPAGVREYDATLKAAVGAVLKPRIDLSHWQRVARERFSSGLPAPELQDPSQWLFHGHPARSSAPLQVAAARLTGYQWPRQTGSSFDDSSSLRLDGLEKHADSDGIVCYPAINREQTAASRFRALLADAFAAPWGTSTERDFIEQTGLALETLEEWLEEGFFSQHCDSFEQRPFVWHIWDGRADGFNALVNYHRLAASDGEGRRTLEKLTHTYLGDWIARQRAAVTAGVDGAEGRLAAAEHLKSDLEKILDGEPPYDIFVRWKPLHEQPIGWEPDINDGVRVNIRPFMMAKPFNARSKDACILRVRPKIKWQKDRGKEPDRPRENYPWFWGWDGSSGPDFDGGSRFDGVRWNDLHYTRARKERARAEYAAKARSGGRG